MNRIVAIMNLCITGFYVCNILKHMFRPEMNVGYTRMLMFACLATIPLVFMLMMVGGKDRWLFLYTQAREMAVGGPLTVMLLVGLAFLLILLPIGMLIGVWFGMGLHFGSMFVLYFVPIISRLIFSTTKDSVLAAVMQGLIFFLSFFIGIGIVVILERFFGGAAIYEKHLQILWPDYSAAAKMFFSVCIFALINQLIEFRQALIFLLNK